MKEVQLFYEVSLFFFFCMNMKTTHSNTLKQIHFKDIMEMIYKIGFTF